MSFCFPSLLPSASPRTPHRSLFLALFFRPTVYPFTVWRKGHKFECLDKTDTATPERSAARRVRNALRGTNVSTRRQRRCRDADGRNSTVILRLEKFLVSCRENIFNHFYGTKIPPKTESRINSWRRVRVACELIAIIENFDNLF